VPSLGQDGYPTRAVNKTFDIVIFADYSMHVRKGQHATVSCQVQVGFLEGSPPVCSDGGGILKMKPVRDLQIADETEGPIRAVKLLCVKRREIRRSQRVRVSVDVEVFWGDANNVVASEKTKTLVVSSHGALKPLRRNVEINELFRLRNTTTHEEIACRVIDLKRVDPLGMSNVGVEFVEPAPRFWHISFPTRGLESPKPWGQRLQAGQQFAIRENSTAKGGATNLDFRSRSQGQETLSTQQKKFQSTQWFSENYSGRIHCDP
jgi:hypothetical protein